MSSSYEDGRQWVAVWAEGCRQECLCRCWCLCLCLWVAVWVEGCRQVWLVLLVVLGSTTSRLQVGVKTRQFAAHELLARFSLKCTNFGLKTFQNSKVIRDTFGCTLPWVAGRRCANQAVWLAWMGLFSKSVWFPANFWISYNFST